MFDIAITGGADGTTDGGIMSGNRTTAIGGPQVHCLPPQQQGKGALYGPISRAILCIIWPQYRGHVVRRSTADLTGVSNSKQFTKQFSSNNLQQKFHMNFYIKQVVLMRGNQASSAHRELLL